MSSIEKLARTKPVENAGSRTSNRFEYQMNWGLSKLLDLEESNEDYVMVFDYHDDIVVCNSDKDSDFIDFYQIKTRKTARWAKGDLTSKLDEDDSCNSINELSILAKLVSHTKVFQNSRHLFFVTNSSLSANLYSRSDNIVKFNEIKENIREQIKNKIREELGGVEDEAFEKIIFIQNQMSVDSYEQTVLGTLSQFLKNKFNLVTDVNVVYETLIGEIRKRNNYEKEIENKEELIKYKAISHAEFSNYLTSLTIQKGFEELKTIIISSISDEVNFFTKDSVTNNLNSIYRDLMDYENDELLNLSSEIRNAISITPVTEDTRGLWDYTNNIFNKLMASYNNYKQHSEYYIKSLILYIYAQNQQRII